MKQNADLKVFYDSVYRKGERGHYSQFLLEQDSMPEEWAAVLAMVDWGGKRVMDVGCGTGGMCALIAQSGASAVVGIDYTESAIAEARTTHPATNLTFVQSDLDAVSGTFDVIVSNGTLEHMDSPLDTLQRLKGMLEPGGSLIVTCPNWLNPRGYMLQVLWHLFRAPITLADLHYLTPVDFETWAEQLAMKLEWFTVEHDWGGGAKMVADLRRRIPKVARDAGWDVPGEQMDAFFAWLERSVVPFKGGAKHEGTVGIYHLRLP